MIIGFINKIFRSNQYIPYRLLLQINENTEIIMELDGTLFMKLF